MGQREPARVRVLPIPLMHTPINPRSGLSAGVWVVATVTLAAACASGPPRRTAGVPASPSTPSSVWVAPPKAGAPLSPVETRIATRGSQLPASAVGHLTTLSLVDVVDIALGNSPQTRASWAQSRSAAAALGSARGRFLPSLTADIVGGPSQAISANPARLPGNRTTIAPTLSLQYLLFDFGGRGECPRRRRKSSSLPI